MKLKLFLYAFAAVGLFGTVSANGQSIAITNARIVTVSGATIEKGTVVIRDGLIESVGADAKAPADAQVIDGNGLTVYPGFVDALTSAGMQTRPATPAGQGGGGGGAQQAQQQAQATQSNSNYPAGLRPEEMATDDLRGGDAQFEAARNAGFASALTVGRSGIFNGQSAFISLAGENASSLVIKTPVALHISFATVGGGQYPGSLLGTFSALRQMFNDARRLAELQKMYAENPRGMKRPEPDRSLEALIPVLNRQIPVVFNANREIEIIRALELAKEYNLKVIIAGGQESSRVVNRLKSQDVPVLLSLNFPKRTTSASPDADPESMDVLRFRSEVPKTAARLAQAGVKFAFQSGQMTSLADFSANAMKTVENGLSREAALRAMTLSPAEIFGVSDRMGSVEAGKIANLTVTRGDIFSSEKTFTHVFVDGKIFEIKAPARPAGAGRPPAGGGQAPAAANVPNVAGSYTITIDVPGQTLTGTLTLVQQGESLTGTMVTQLGNSAVTAGRVSAEGFSFVSTVQFGGAAIDISVRGSVAGNQISGSIDSPQGTVSFSGIRTP